MVMLSTVVSTEYLNIYLVLFIITSVAYSHKALGRVTFAVACRKVGSLTGNSYVQIRFRWSSKAGF